MIVFYFQLPASARGRILAKAGAAVAPGGTLLVVGHDLLNLTEGVGGPKDPAVLFTPQDVLAVACDGLVVEKAERVTRPVETEAGTRFAIDALVRARLGEEADAALPVGRMDLWAANVAQLRSAGVRTIEVSALCTRCGGADVWSYRARGEDGAYGTCLAYLGWPAAGRPGDVSTTGVGR